MSPSTSSSRDPLEQGSTPWGDHRTAPMPVVPSDDPRSTSRQTGDEPQATRPLPQEGGSTPSSTSEPRDVASGRLRSGQQDTEDTSRRDGTLHEDRPVTATAAWDSMEPAVGTGRATRHVPTAETVRARQKERFGGLQVIPGLLGWLAALALGTLLMVVATAVGAPNGLDLDGGAGQALTEGLENANNPGVWAALVVLGLVELIAFLAGGYAAGRMARFSGVAQGFSVWLWSLLGRALASVALLFLADTAGLVPRDLTAQSVIGGNLGIGLIALVAVLMVDLLGAVLGGIWGTRFHRKVDTWTHSNVLTQ